MSICAELEELIPAYVLGALDASERSRVERHLADCPELRKQIALYESVSAQLAYAATPVEPRRELKYRVLEAVSPQPRREFSLSSLFGALVRSPALAVLALVVAIGIGMWNLSLQNQLALQAAFNQQMQSEISRQRGLVSTIAYSDSQPRRMQAAEAAPNAVGRLYPAPELNTLALIVYDMPVLEPKQVYQFWLIDSGGDRTSGGTFRVDEQGRGWVLVRSPKPLSQFQGVGITIEPEGGSPKPTGPRVMGTSL